jgi:hypothetical protein
MDGAYNMYGKDEKCIQILVGKPEWKRPLDLGIDGKIILE